MRFYGDMGTSFKGSVSSTAIEVLATGFVLLMRGTFSESLGFVRFFFCFGSLLGLELLRKSLV